MSNSSRSKRATTNSTSNIQTTDQSYKDSSRAYEDSFNTDNSQNDSNNVYLDGGAIRSAFDFSSDTLNKSLNTVNDTTRASLDFSSDTLNKSLTIAERATNSALDFASNISREATNPGSDFSKYALIGLGLVAVAAVVKK
ncbi:MAG: hypothetical protein ISEC1_P1937 [Thiomicrorhabdus sp.]|nr:MAG: hypothetical protein ISEC1_P1937 [Thiomicrorhabdus sp.]